MKEAKKLDNAEEILELPISYEERGKEIGQKIGKEERRAEERIRVARNMLLKGLDIQLIIETTMLSTEEIEALKK